MAKQSPFFHVGFQKFLFAKWPQSHAAVHYNEENGDDGADEVVVTVYTCSTENPKTSVKGTHSRRVFCVCVPLSQYPAEVYENSNEISSPSFLSNFKRRRECKIPVSCKSRATSGNDRVCDEHFQTIKVMFFFVRNASDTDFSKERESRRSCVN